MPLETLNHDAFINIRNLSTETPEKEWRPHFDPKLDLSERDWKEMVGVLSRNETGHALAEYASRLAIMDRPKVLSVLKNQEWVKMVAALDEFRHYSEWYAFAQQAARMFSLDKTRVEITEEDWANILSQANSLLGKRRWSQFIVLAGNIAVLNRAKLPSFSQEEWQGILSVLSVGYINRPAFAHTAAQVIKIDPAQISIIGESDWQHMRTQFNKYRDLELWEKAITIAYSLTVLSNAERAMHETQFEPPVPPLPETRAF